MISKLPWRSRKGVMVLTFVLLSIFGSVSCTNLEDELRITYEQKFAIDKVIPLEIVHNMHFYFLLLL